MLERERAMGISKGYITTVAMNSNDTIPYEYGSKYISSHCPIGLFKMLQNLLAPRSEVA